MFKYSVFVRKNTQELRDKLEEMGYNEKIFFKTEDTDSICTSIDNIYVRITQKSFDDENPHINWKSNRIDCDTNEKAFLAIAAINDDTDKNQWFIMNGYIFEYSEETVLLKDHWYFCDNDNIKDCFELLPGDNINIRKATPDEILNRLDEN